MMKKFLCVLLAIWLCTITVSAGISFQTDADLGGEVVVMTVPATQGMSVGAKAAIVMEAGTGKILFAQNADTPLPFASTTKIMTALLTLEQQGLDNEFEVDPQAIKVEGSSMGLVKGDKVTLRTLAAGMLLPSGNDAANAAAVRISGSIPAFVELMNRRAKEMGLKNTSFETPSGLDGENHYSTAFDLAQLAREALKNTDFAEICSQYKMRVSYGNPPYNRWLTNHNKLVNYYDGAMGMKTGFTKKAGRCLVSCAQRNGVTLICVTLSCPDDWNTHTNLYDYFFDRMQVEDLSKDLPAITVPVTGGVSPTVNAIKSGNAQIAIPIQGAQVEYIVQVQPFLYAPVAAGQTLGQVEIVLDGQVVSTLDLLSQQDVPLLNPYIEKKSFGAWLQGIWNKWFPEKS